MTLESHHNDKNTAQMRAEARQISRAIDNYTPLTKSKRRNQISLNEVNE